MNNSFFKIAICKYSFSIGFVITSVLLSRWLCNLTRGLLLAVACPLFRDNYIYCSGIPRSFAFFDHAFFFFILFQFSFDKPESLNIFS